MREIWGIQPGWGLTAVRIAMAAIVLHAGWGKVAMGMAGVGGLFGRIGIPLPEITGPFIMILELVGGILLLLGIATRWIGLLFAIEFLVAASYVRFPAGFAEGRLELMLLAGGLLFFLSGPGKAAVDEVWLEKA